MLSAAFLPPSPLLRHSSAASLISQARPRIMLRTRSLFPTKPPRCAQDPPSESSYLLDDATQQSSIASTLPPDVQPSQSTDKTAQQSPPIHSQQPPPMPGIVQSTAPLDPRVLFAEFLSTFLFVYLSVNAAATSVNPLANSVNNAAVIAAVAASFMPVSGAHLNPAVTLALAITNRVPLKRAIAFVPVQLLAAAAACMLAKILGVSVAFAGIAVDSSKAELVRAFFAELVPMFTIVIILFQTAVATETEGGVGAKLAALYIGLAVLACAGTFTTGVFNPARAFGPALVSSSFSNHWVYWLGPFVGATLAALMSEHWFLAPAAKRDPNSWLSLFTRQSSKLGSRIKHFGVAGIVAYGILNTLYYGTVFSVMMFKIGWASGASGLVQAWIVTWSFSQVTKPLRFALSLALAPFVDRMLRAGKRLRDKI